MATHKSFATVTTGLDRKSPPMRLYEKAKKYGIWNPSEIDLTADRTHWQTLSEEEQDLILRLTALFAAGEEAVTLDLLPLIQVIAQEGRLEEEIYLTSFLFEEAKHTDFFRRVLDEVCQHPGDLSHYHSPSYQHIFYQHLPASLHQLKDNPAPANQIRASVTYNMIVEGMLAETGYHAFFTMLERQNLMPGLRTGISQLKQDESRHIAYGIFLLSRLVAEHPHLWSELESQMDSLLYPAVAIISEVFSAYEVPPFGLVEEDFVNYAMDQFQKRFARLEKARGAGLAEIIKTTNQVIEEDNA
jgi:ribonucleoside-diphosphate reductase beta chain